jgi:hypothetical protein
MVVMCMGQFRLIWQSRGKQVACCYGSHHVSSIPSCIFHEQAGRSNYRRRSLPAQGKRVIVCASVGRTLCGFGYDAGFGGMAML